MLLGKQYAWWEEPMCNSGVRLIPGSVLRYRVKEGQNKAGNHFAPIGSATGIRATGSLRRAIGSLRHMFVKDHVCQHAFTNQDEYLHLNPSAQNIYPGLRAVQHIIRLGWQRFW